MKKKLKKALIIFMCLATTIPISIFAANEGGTGSSGGNSGGAGGADSDCTPDTYWQVGYDDGDGYEGIGTTAAFRYDLVYKEQNGGREILKTVIDTIIINTIIKIVRFSFLLFIFLSFINFVLYLIR